MRLHFIPTLAVTLLTASTFLHAAGIPNVTFDLLSDPGQNYTFNRTDSQGQSVTDPVGPYPGYLGADVPGDLYGFFCIDYLLTATWGGSYSGTVYNIGDAIPGKSLEQQLEGGYLSSQLYQLGGGSANTALYQGPISFAIWQIMDPATGHVPVDPAAQSWVLQAQNMYADGQLSAANYSNTLIFVPDNSSIQDFMTLSPATTPEPQTTTLSAAGALLILVGSLRRRK